MAEVISLAERAAEREQRDRDLDAARALHPSLRWVAGKAFWAAHRKVDGAAACGQPGDLMLATPGVPLCVQCFPPEMPEPRGGGEG